MAVWVVTGKLGSGKSLISVSKIREALEQGRLVATNLDIYLKNMFGKRSSKTLIRLPDKPTRHDMEMIGIGNHSYDESKNGLIVLDELGTWLNSRSWNDKTRAPLLDWFLHARKKGWDIIFIVQDVNIIDKQFRETLAEMTAFCRRLDRMQIPLIGPLVSLITGFRIPLPKLHMAKVVYGDSPTDLKIDAWYYTGIDLYKSYDTKQIFDDRYAHGVHSLLSPKYLNKEKQAARNWKNFMRQTKIVWKRFASPVSMATGVLLGTAAALIFANNSEPVVEQTPVEAQIEKPVSYREQKLKDLVSRLFIAGTSKTDSRIKYYLADINDEQRLKMITDKDLATMGLIVRSISDCTLEVKVGFEVYPVYCMP